MRLVRIAIAALLLGWALGAEGQPGVAAQRPGTHGSEINPGLTPELGNGRVITGASRQRIVLFTFDDGPHPVHTPRVLDLLDQRGIKAVFFVVARGLAPGGPLWQEKVRLAQETIRRGHFIGLHGLDHTSLGMMRQGQLQRELLLSEQIFTTALGGRPWLFRPPGGFRTRTSDRILSARGYTQLLWNHHSGDSQVSRGRDVLATWERSMRRMERRGGHGGGIVVLHDTHAHSLEGFERIHDALLQRNCQLFARNEELFDVVDHPRWFFSPRGDAAADVDAPPGAMPDDIHAERQARLRQETAARCGPE